MTVALPPGEADREIGLLVPVAAGGFADPQQVFARDREAADQGRVYESEGFFEDAERFDVLASRDDRFCGGVAVMYPVVVEGFGKIDDISPPRYDLYPEQPVAAITVLGVIVACGERTAPYQCHSCVVDGVPRAEKTVEEETAAESDLLVFGVFDGRFLPYGPGVGIDDIAAGENYAAIRTGVENPDAPFQKTGRGKVVAFGDPHVIALGFRQPLFPLFERRAAVPFIIKNAGNFGVIAVSFENFTAAVCRTIVEQNQFEILKRLLQNTFYTLFEIGCMTVVWDNDRNGGHTKNVLSLIRLQR